jgi:hypothetical protein
VLLESTTDGLAIHRTTMHLLAQVRRPAFRGSRDLVKQNRRGLVEGLPFADRDRRSTGPRALPALLANLDWHGYDVANQVIPSIRVAIHRLARLVGSASQEAILAGSRVAAQRIVAILGAA